jgi:hypothetical protein
VALRQIDISISVNLIKLAFVDTFLVSAALKHRAGGSDAHPKLEAFDAALQAQAWVPEFGS